MLLWLYAIYTRCCLAASGSSLADFNLQSSRAYCKRLSADVGRSICRDLIQRAIQCWETRKTQHRRWWIRWMLRKVNNLPTNVFLIIAQGGVSKYFSPWLSCVMCTLNHGRYGHTAILVNNINTTTWNIFETFIMCYSYWLMKGKFRAHGPNEIFCIETVWL